MFDPKATLKAHVSKVAVPIWALGVLTIWNSEGNLILRTAHLHMKVGQGHPRL